MENSDLELLYSRLAFARLNEAVEQAIERLAEDIVDAALTQIIGELLLHE